MASHHTSEETLDSATLAKTLREHIRGEVSFSPAARALYSADASNYRQVPIGVVLPKSKNDVLVALAICREFRVPVFSRGAGTSLAGQCCNVAVVLDCSKYLNTILEIDAEAESARVEPGVTCDRLRHAAAPYGLTWGPDPATHAYCTFGGMIGNNSCGVHSQIAGKTEDNVIGMEIVLYDGTCLNAGWTDDARVEMEIARGGRVSEIYSKLRALAKRYAPLIRERFPKLPRRVSGYNLDQLVPGPDGRWNLARALVGSESTCVTVLEATVQLIHQHPCHTLVALGYPDIYVAADHVPAIVRFRPTGLEGFDDITTGNILKKRLPQETHLSLLPQGAGWLLVEFGGSSREEALDQARHFAESRNDYGNPTAKIYAADSQQRELWSIRESALGANSFVPGQAPTWEGWEDSAVVPEHLGKYLRDLRHLYEKYGYESAFYGHFGQGCVHNRATFDLTSAAGTAKWRTFLEEATDLVVSYGGSLSGEHGDGQARGEFLYKMYGPELVEAFREFKSIWDPDGKMNPGKIVNARPADDSLRAQIPQRLVMPKTHFSFSSDGGSFDNAVSRCVGVGKCRRLEGNSEHNTMCPSYMVTQEEKHSTRGRAHLLWEMLRGDLLMDGWRNKEVKEALELCLACKACKSECPVNVDMATYKAEFLSHFWEGRIRPLSAYAFAWINKWARAAEIAPSLPNALMRLPGLQRLVKTLFSIAPERNPPRFAQQTFRRWFQKRPFRNATGRRVLLWPDTFNNHFTPQPLRAAVETLEAAGFHVEIPPSSLCCGRPLYDQGFLDMAKTYLLRTIGELAPQIKAGTPIVVLEPSCCSVFRDEMCALFPNLRAAQEFRKLVFTFAEFLDKKAPHLTFTALNRQAVMQGHCHQKAVLSLTADKVLLGRIGVETRVLESGCCGMAGAFGYEKSKYPVSVACAERVLLPELNRLSSETLVLADGFSCREQILQLNGRRALHLAEVALLALQDRSDRSQQ